MTTMDPPTQASLDQILATIPPQNRPLLDQKISDIHLANIAKSLISWKSVCSHLGITEPEEEAIEEENRTADSRRYVGRPCEVCKGLVSSTCGCVAFCTVVLR